jgi:hypothetical protein
MKTILLKNPHTGLVKIVKAIDPAASVRALEDAAGQRFELLIEVDGEHSIDGVQFDAWIEDDGRVQAWLQQNAPQEWA